MARALQRCSSGALFTQRQRPSTNQISRQIIHELDNPTDLKRSEQILDHINIKSTKFHICSIIRSH